MQWKLEKKVVLRRLENISEGWSSVKRTGNLYWRILRMISVWSASKKLLRVLPREVRHTCLVQFNTLFSTYTYNTRFGAQGTLHGSLLNFRVKFAEFPSEVFWTSGRSFLNFSAEFRDIPGKVPWTSGSSSINFRANLSELPKNFYELPKKLPEFLKKFPRRYLILQHRAWTSEGPT